MSELLILILVLVGAAQITKHRGWLKKIEGELYLIKIRLVELENRPVTAPVTEPSGVPEEIIAETTVAEPIAEQRVEERQSEAGKKASVVLKHEPEPVAATRQPAEQKQSLEVRLGAQWTVWVGGIALAFGGLFVVRYAIEQGILSPAVRVVLAGIFGTALMIAGEVIRRRTSEQELSNFRSTMIPGILTAVGALTLFGAVFVTHNFYGFIGPATAFILLGLVSLLTIVLSLRHGQALAGLGLLASFVTPALVTSDEAKPWSLFGFLTIVWLSNLAASRFKRWDIAPMLANIGLAIWAAIYVLSVYLFETFPVVLAMLVMIAGTAFLWPARDGQAKLRANQKSSTGGLSAMERSVQTVLLPPHGVVTGTAALAAGIVALAMVSPGAYAVWPAQGFVVLILALAGLGALRVTAAYPSLFAALAAWFGVLSIGVTTGPGTVVLTGSMGEPETVDARTALWLVFILGAGFIGLGSWVLHRTLNSVPGYGLVWSGLMTIIPLAMAGISFVYFGNYLLDWQHGIYALILGGVYLALSDWTARAKTETLWLSASNILLAGSYTALMFALMVLTNGLATTVGAAIVGFAYALAIRARPWPLMPWFMVVSGIFVAGRIALDPTIVGPEHLGAAPVFNALLAGYGLPALLLSISAYRVGSSTDLRLRNALEALASLFVLMTVAIVVRHAMNGGVLNDAIPTLGEQSIYTLLAIGASATLMTLDLKRPSIIFKRGSMLLGVTSMVFVLIAHLFTLNPYFSGESTGRIPVFNLLLIAYLLPGFAYGAVAWFARSRRPVPYVMALALSGAVLAFSYASLSVRRFWHGEFIPGWKGFLQSETYTYSVVWLLLGVALLVVGYRFRAISIRIASAVLVLIAVLKVFLIDMSSLEGLLRALSFIGLGLVLIGIGRFYQRMLMGNLDHGREG